MFNDIRLSLQFISERLLVGGIAPRQVKRIISELKDHYVDLREESLEQGSTESEAEQEAMSRLGDKQSIVTETLSKPELRSWSSRWPWAVYGIAPLVLGVFGVFAFCFIAFIPIAMTSGGLFDSPENYPEELFFLSILYVEVMFLAAQFVVLPLLILFLCYQATIRRDSLHWPIIGLVTLCAVVSGFHSTIVWPIEGINGGGISASLSFIPPFPFFWTTLLKFIANLGFAAFCFIWFRRKMTISREEFQ